MQFAADLALAKVVRADNTWAADGTFKLAGDNKRLVADLDPEKWQSTFQKGSQAPSGDNSGSQGQKKIIGLETLLGSLLGAEAPIGPAILLEIASLFGTHFLGAPDVKLRDDIKEAIDAWRAETKPLPAGQFGPPEQKTSAAQHVTFFEIATKDENTTLDAGEDIKSTLGKDGNARTAVPNAFDGVKGGVVLVGSIKDDKLKGSLGSDLIVAAKGNDEVTRSDGGKDFDLYFLDEGEDKYLYAEVTRPSGTEGGSPTTGPATGKARIFGGVGKDVADYSASKKGFLLEELRAGQEVGAFRVIYLDDKGKAADQIQFEDLLFSFDKLKESNYGDEWINKQSVKTTLDQLKDRGVSIVDWVLDLFGQGPVPNAPAAPGAPPPPPPKPDHGDKINFEGGGTAASAGANGQDTPTKGVVVDLRDEDKQFAADAQGQLPTRLGLAGVFPTAGLWQQLKFYNLVKAELDTPRPFKESVR